MNAIPPQSTSPTFVGMPSFPSAAREALANTQQRRNLAHATATIRAKRAQVVGEVEAWEDLRVAGAEAKDEALHHLPHYLEQLETNLTERGATVHWAGTPTRRPRSRGGCWNRSGWRTRRTPTRRVCPAVSPSASPSPGPWPWNRR